MVHPGAAWRRGAGCRRGGLLARVALRGERSRGRRGGVHGVSRRRARRIEHSTRGRRPTRGAVDTPRRRRASRSACGPSSGRRASRPFPSRRWNARWFFGKRGRDGPCGVGPLAGRDPRGRRTVAPFRVSRGARRDIGALDRRLPRARRPPRRHGRSLGGRRRGKPSPHAGVPAERGARPSRGPGSLAVSSRHRARGPPRALGGERRSARNGRCRHDPRARDRVHARLGNETARLAGGPLANVLHGDRSVRSGPERSPT